MDVLLIRAFALLGLAILVALAARRLRLPYTVGLALAGAALATFRVNAGLALTHDLIFDVVLPPLLFEAALNLHWSELRRDLAPVVALSTVGVALSACVVAGGMHAWLGWPIESALVFGALIAATDPIAVIALLRESAITGRLRLLIEAESLVNDGAAAVLFTLILAWAARDPSAAGGPLAVASAFAVIAGGGLLVGLLVGLAAVAWREPRTITSLRPLCRRSPPSARSSLPSTFMPPACSRPSPPASSWAISAFSGPRRAWAWR